MILPLFSCDNAFMTQEMISADVAIIGAGPTGLFAVFECGMSGMSTIVFDSLTEIGGQCTALYPEKPIYDIPGLPEVLAGDLIANLEKQAAPFNPIYRLGQQIVSISQDNGGWILKTSVGDTARVSAIIIAAGAGAFGPNRPPLDAIEAYEGKSVFYMVRRKDDFKDKSIVIAGGGDSAIDWALALAPIAKQIHLVHRRDKFRAAPESMRQIEFLASVGKVVLAVPYQLHALHGADGNIQQVELKNSNDDTSMMVDADVLLPFFGLATELGPLANWGLNLDNNHITVDPFTCSTNVNGVYAIGDIAAYKNKMKLILTGFNEGALAAQAIRKQLNPGQEFHFEYSTTKGVPTAA
jgi:thioredoxin reductase (NADPH)